MGNNSQIVTSGKKKTIKATTAIIILSIATLIFVPTTLVWIENIGSYEALAAYILSPVALLIPLFASILSLPIAKREKVSYVIFTYLLLSTVLAVLCVVVRALEGTYQGTIAVYTYSHVTRVEYINAFADYLMVVMMLTIPLPLRGLYLINKMKKENNKKDKKSTK